MDLQPSCSCLIQIVFKIRSLRLWSQSCRKNWCTSHEAGEAPYGSSHSSLWYIRHPGGVSNEWGSRSWSWGFRSLWQDIPESLKMEAKLCSAASAERPGITRSTVTKCQDFLWEYEVPCWLSSHPHLLTQAWVFVCLFYLLKFIFF